MKAYQINLITGIVLVVMGLWGYLGSADPSVTALIPVVFGIIFLALTPQMRRENRLVAHTVVVLTLIILISLATRPLISVLKEGEITGIIRVGSMTLFCIIAMAVYIKSFIDARRAKG